MKWEPLNLKHKPLLQNALREYPLTLSDYTFTNFWIWNIHRHYQIASIDNFVCLRFVEGGSFMYLYPIGAGQRKTIVEKLMKLDTDFRMRAIPEEGLSELQELSLHIKAEEDHFDYIYAYDDLLYLSGDQFQAKRNFIHQFENRYVYHYQEITPSFIPSIIEAEKIWFNEHSDSSPGRILEHEAVLLALQDFSVLEVFGGALLVDRKVVAFSIAEYLTKDMLVIHLEKALKEYKGGYAMINQQVLKHSSPVTFVNREEDLGLDNLIKVKQSYHPVRLEKKFLATHSNGIVCCLTEK